MNGTGTVIPLPLPYLYRTFVDVFLTHTVYISGQGQRELVVQWNLS